MVLTGFHKVFVSNPGRGPFVLIKDFCDFPRLIKANFNVNYTI
jgi:hypothetical protein